MLEEAGIDYRHMMENALRDVIRRALLQVADHGLPGGHHFFISFRTGDEGVQVPEFLRKQYPDEMTVVIENQFKDLAVTGEEFSVTLNFSAIPQRLTVPFVSITSFADPSVSFGLRFEAAVDEIADDGVPEDKLPGRRPAAGARRRATPKGEVVPFAKAPKDEPGG
jgi:hypothetical protein